MFRWSQTLTGKLVAESSVKRDVEVFLRTYVPSRQSRGDIAEDSLDCPLIELGLITQATGGQTYRFRRGLQSTLPDGILMYGMHSFWRAFAPDAPLQAALAHADAMGYRTHEFGDAMVVI